MNNATNVLAAFREMTANKAISRDELQDLIKDGILAALAKRYGPNVEAEIEIDEATGAINITVLREVVAEVEDSSRQIALEEARWDDPDFEVGDVMEVPVEFAQFGRNAVMAAKQRILQRVREADAIVPWKEQNPRERFRQGETIRAVLKKVEETPKGPRLILSRADPLFVAALFKLEVPEINQGIVDIRAVSREVGGRTKLAVSSRDESIDPVGACVGLKGSRVRAVVQELGGERIDIVPWHPDPEIFAKRSLAPARVAKVMSDIEHRVVTAIVDEDQLSLAIGRNGQNVRLASQLHGWQLDLYGSREWLEHGAERTLFGGGGEGDEESQDFPLGDLDLPPATLAALQLAGYNTFFDIIDLERDDLLRIPAINAVDAERIAQLIEEMTVEEEAEGAAAPADGAAGPA